VSGHGVEHTPGPWTIESAPHRAFVAQVGNGQLHIWTERQAKPGESYEWGSALADAYLIAAAPDLQQALAKLVECIHETRGPAAHEALTEARAALALSRGGPQL
jgi:hypothetical protein